MVPWYTASPQHLSSTITTDAILFLRNWNTDFACRRHDIFITLHKRNEVDTLCYDDEKKADAIFYACDSMNVPVFNCSWHIDYVMTESYLSAIDYATQHGRHGKGCIIVFFFGYIGPKLNRVEKSLR